MSTREAKPQASARHPVDWKSAEFYDKDACWQEMARVFDICHGCRKCVGLCQSFPTLFDLVDATEDGEVHGVKQEAYWEVVDQCYLCDLCHLAKCPYVPPHPWNLDFPHLMLRAKAIKHSRGLVGTGERLLASTDVHGSFAGIPVVVQAVNAVNRSKPGRALLDAALGVHPEAWLPALASQRFRWRADQTAGAVPAVDGARAPGKVAVFASCYVNCHEPGIGHDLLKVLAHNGIAYELVDEESCCGMPKLELGDLPGVERLKNANIPVLARYARAGWAIVSAVPSCTLMFKQTLPLLFEQDAEVQEVKHAVFDSFEYLVARHKDGLLRTDFKRDLGRISHHVACHGRVQNIGRKTEEMFRLVGKSVALQLTTVERCSGHGGTYGVKTATHGLAMKIGKPVFKAMAKDSPDSISSDCPLAGHHIAQGMAQAGHPNSAVQHPLSLLRQAYGLD